MFGGNSNGLKFKPKTQTFSNSTGTNTFDGVRAESYGLIYAQVLTTGKVVIITHAEIGWRARKSPTTSRHIVELCRLLNIHPWYRSETDKVVSVEIHAPNGLGDLAQARKDINQQVENMLDMAKRGRIKNREWRLKRAEEYRAMLLLIDEIAEDNAIRKALANSYFYNEVA